MLRPTKHSHPDKTVINVACLLILRLRKRRLEEFGELLRYVKKFVKHGESLFLPALNFLYLLGLIEYRPKTDSIEYTGKHEAL